ncbi:MAG: polysaccharide deacetylase family protein [Paenibacillaceae bacterium]
MSGIKRHWLILATSCFVVIITWGFMGMMGADAYILQIKQGMNQPSMIFMDPLEAPFSTPNDQAWMKKIITEANQRKIAAIDAKVDRVWKAIPGYNGLEVDIQKTWQLNKHAKLDQPIRFVYKEIKPKVDLQALGAYPIYRGNPKKPMVSLLINVAWGDEFIPILLKVLNKENVHATFFFDGSWLNKHVKTAQLIGKAGHELSNHAYSHKNMSQLDRGSATSEIVKTQLLLETKLGVKNTLFAPPSGDFDDETVQIAHQLHLKTILWSIDTLDWTNPSPETIVTKVTKRLEPGAMILMHPTASSSMALESIIKEVKRRGFVLGTVSELLSSDRINATQSIQ